MDNLIGDVEGEKDNQIYDSDYKKIVQETNLIRNPEELRSYKSEEIYYYSYRYSYCQIIFSWKVKENLIYINELSTTSLIIDTNNQHPISKNSI